MTRILLVEDDKTIVSNLTEFLSKEGFDIKSTSGQSGALALLDTARFDLVLLDISLSDGSGYTVCKAVKADYHIPVIFLTASAVLLSCSATYCESFVKLSFYLLTFICRSMLFDLC